MIRVCTVEAGTTGDQDLLLTEKIKGKLLIILDMEFLLIQFREYVERSFWFHNGYTGNVTEGIVDIFTLFVDSSARKQEFIGTLITAQRSLNDTLCMNKDALKTEDSDLRCSLLHDPFCRIDTSSRYGNRLHDGIWTDR